MSNLDRAPEPTLEDIFASIHGAPAQSGTPEWPNQQAAPAKDDTSKSLNETIAAIEKAISAMRELSISPSHQNQDTPPAASIEPMAERLADTTDESVAPSPVSWPEERAEVPSPSKPSRPRRRSSQLRTPEAVAASDDFAFAAMPESSLKDVLRPLLRRWIDENMAKAFEPSLRDELRQTGMPRWKQRRHLNRWRRQSRRAH
jgi:cell pole-organizing protein PopZ